MSPVDYNQRLPSHYCAKCSHVVFDDDDVCPGCESEQPAEGWPSIQDGFDPWLGRMLDGRYVVTQQVGHGSMGTVYRARSLAIAREFAVKVINFKEGVSGLDAEQVRARLHREIEAIGRLRNPHVVPFYEVLEIFDHYVGVVMDYVDGPTIEALVHEAGPLQPLRAMQILRQVANGVHEAHEAGMIHRDLKPDNFMVEKMPAGDDFAHVLDFGIVRIEDGVSMTKGFLGTPLYASPEQAMSGDVDRRSDIYSLGAVVFFMLTGRPPFQSDNVYELLQSHVRTAPPTLADVYPGRDFPEVLEALVAKMLEKSPEKRPQDLTEVIQTVDAMIRGGALDRFDDDPAPDSMEMVFDSTGTTLTGNGHQTDGLGEESSSIFESSERDRTGPKAAIFNRGKSRSGIWRALEAERKTEKNEFDRVFQGTTGAHTLGVHIPFRTTVAAACDTGQLLLASSPGHVVRIDGAMVEDLGKVENLCCLGLNQNTALAGLDDGTILRIDEDQHRPLFRSTEPDTITGLALARDDQSWFACTEGGRLYRCQPKSGERTWNRLQDGPPATAVAVSPRADTIAVARKHGEVEVTSVGSPDAPYARFSVSGPVRALAFSNDGHLIAALIGDDTVAVYLVEQGTRVHMLRDERNRLLSVAFNDQELLGYFQVDGKLCARQMDRAIAPSQPDS